MTRTLLIGAWMCLAAAGAAAGSPPQSATYGATAQKQKQTPAGRTPDKPNDPGMLVQLAERDNLFLTNATEVGLNDVWLGRLAASKGSDPAVRRFGTKLVDAHSAANVELRTLATARKIAFATEPSAHLHATVKRLSALSGAAFDRAIMTELYARQTRNRALFQRTAQGGTDPRVKAFAARLLTVVQDHQVIARDLTLKSVRVSPQQSSATRGE